MMTGRPGKLWHGTVSLQQTVYNKYNKDILRSQLDSRTLDFSVENESNGGVKADGRDSSARSSG